MAEKTYGINIDVTTGPMGPYGISVEFQFQRKVTGCIDAHDAKKQILAMLSDLAERLTSQLEHTYPQLTNGEAEE